MAGTNGTLLHTHLPNPTLSHLFAALDPISLILSQFPNNEKPNLFHLTTMNFPTERGPRYEAYARLRESKLRMKTQFREPESKSILPVKKQGKFQGTPPSGRKGYSVLAQSVDFGGVVRKENRRPPVAALPPVMVSPMKTPASVKEMKMMGIGAKSINLGEKRSSGAMARKRYASMEEMRGKRVLGYKHY